MPTRPRLPSTTRPCGPTWPSRSLARRWPASRRPCAARPRSAQRLEDVRQDRPESAVHTLGAIWRRARLSCPDREELGGYLLEALDPEHLDYITFHLDVVECPFCRANLADLRGQFAADAPTSQTRQHRYFQSSRHLLSGDE